MNKAELEPLSFHKLRHTAAALLLSSGKPLTVIRDQLGHSQNGYRANIWGHAAPSALREASERLEQLAKDNSKAKAKEGL